MKILKVKILEAKSIKVRARADVTFSWFLLKGFKILDNPDTKKNYVTPPSYLSPKGWRQLFVTTKLEDWQEIQRRILNEYDTKLINDSLSEKEKEPKRKK